ncbi:hypothetical protein TAMA11512_05460 [Selenomonas sp. TAMA-11512]|uniref:copper amine oxidase n=1 Tax=Selenomonas sp. TAMA-11512 TaxID=3095337 RepID=UPI00308C3CC8|nr:hypothetical protein TAMA11512_05460 [Selenomonas sp. TAMA-11512]
MKAWKKKILAGLLAGGLICSVSAETTEAAGKAHRPPRQYRDADAGAESNRTHHVQLLGGGRRAKEAMEREASGKAGPTAETLVNSDEQVVFRNGVLKNNREVPMQLLPTKMEDVGGTLLFSDSPEYVREDGILYQDTVLGEARILYYHLNETDRPKRLAVLLENPNDKMIEVKLTRGGASQPSADYLAVGKATQIQYFRDEVKESRFIPRGQGRLLRIDMAQTLLRPGQLVYGVYDFFSEHPVKVSVIMYPPDQDPFLFVRQAKILPKDEQRLRGTFRGMNRKITSRTVYNPKKNGVSYIMIGDDRRDPFREGIDATDGSTVKNVGNYGILYEFSLPTNRQTTRCYLTPFGGVYTGAVRAKHGKESWMVETPAGLPYYGDVIPQDTADDIEAREQGLGRLRLGAPLAELGTFEGKEQVSFEYSPPGASNLPIALILMP